MTTPGTGWPDKLSKKKMETGHFVPRIRLLPRTSKMGKSQSHFNESTLLWLDNADSVEFWPDPANKQFTIKAKGQYPLGRRQVNNGCYANIADAQFLPSGIYIAVGGKPGTFELYQPNKIEDE